MFIRLFFINNLFKFQLWPRWRKWSKRLSSRGFIRSDFRQYWSPEPEITAKSRLTSRPSNRRTSASTGVTMEITPTTESLKVNAKVKHLATWLVMANGFSTGILSPVDPASPGADVINKLCLISANSDLFFIYFRPCIILISMSCTTESLKVNVKVKAFLPEYSWLMDPLIEHSTVDSVDPWANVINMGQSRPHFRLFSSFYQSNFNNTNWKKRRWCDWVLNLGLQEGRRRWNHRAMTATHVQTLAKHNLVMMKLSTIID